MIVMVERMEEHGSQSDKLTHGEKPIWNSHGVERSTFTKLNGAQRGGSWS